MPRVAETWGGEEKRRWYKARLVSGIAEPVLFRRRSTEVRSVALQAKIWGTTGFRVSSLASGEKRRVTTPLKGTKAPFKATIDCGFSWPSRLMRAAMAAPADLQPKTAVVSLPLPAGDRSGLRVRVALADGGEEVTQLNNRVDVPR